MIPTRYKIERIEVRQFGLSGAGTVIGVAYNVKVDDITYQVSTDGDDAPVSSGVGFWIRGKNVDEALIGDSR